MASDKGEPIRSEDLNNFDSQNNSYRHGDFTRDTVAIHYTTACILALQLLFAKTTRPARIHRQSGIDTDEAQLITRICDEICARELRISR